MSRAPRQPALSRERILDAALRLADAEGVEALSMRRLAQELDVWPMAVYRWFRDKDELVAALGEAAAARVAAPDDGPWPERLAALLEAVHAELRDHPAAPVAGLQAAGAGVLEDAGLSPAEALRLWPALAGLAAGFRGPDVDVAVRLLVDGVAARAAAPAERGG